MIIGRKADQQELLRAYHSEYSDFVAVTGRRRIGKTFGHFTPILLSETPGKDWPSIASALHMSNRSSRHWASPVYPPRSIPGSYAPTSRERAPR